mgnify:CR=1 FL=1|jgi:hypothetical protein
MRKRGVMTVLLMAMATPVLAGSEEALDEARAALDEQLVNTMGVISVSSADCDGTPCINVFVEEMEPAITKDIPAEIKGFKVRVQVGTPIGF